MLERLSDGCVASCGEQGGLVVAVAFGGIDRRRQVGQAFTDALTDSADISVRTSANRRTAPQSTRKS